MKAQELRIGNNIVFSEENEICKVVGIPPQHTGKGIDVYFDSGEEVWIELEKFHPLEITPELLKKAGFVRTFKGCYKPMPVVKGEIHFEKIGNGYVCVLYCSTGALIPNDIKHVHQLQNLYFDLTGEEITI